MLVIRVLISRADGLTGPVEVRCEGLPAGIVAPAHSDCRRSRRSPFDHHLSNRGGSQCPQGTGRPGAVEDQGSAHVAQPMEAEAVSAAVTWENIPSWNSLIGRLSEQLVLYVNEQDTMPVTFNVGTDQTLVMARGGERHCRSLSRVDRVVPTRPSCELRRLATQSHVGRCNVGRQCE